MFQSRSRPYRKKTIGWFVDAAILGTGLIIGVVMALLTYNGTCSSAGFMGGASRPCSLPKYVVREIFTDAFIILLYLWWLVIPLLVLPPAIGAILDRARSKRQG